MMDVAPYTIRHQGEFTLSACLHSHTLTLHKQKVTESREVTLLHYDGWTGETAGEVDDVMSVVDHLMTLPSSQTYIVQCTDGVRKSGLFCALCDVIGRMTYDEEVDVYMSVRHIQSVAPRAVSSLVQYRYLYQAAQRRGAQLSVYANEEQQVGHSAMTMYRQADQQAGHSAMTMYRQADQQAGHSAMTMYRPTDPGTTGRPFRHDDVSSD
ncbi:hypothetical protein ACOMHN_044653 [Nucella lapillus]